MRLIFAIPYSLPVFLVFLNSLNSATPLPAGDNLGLFWDVRLRWGPMISVQPSSASS
jgi:hypothetical protein